ncbi:MAG: hypothetical protein O2856_04645 [Planctomycetota bacterium]|nr:hypothetical protein [Planctomycetota bacterium]
MNPHQPPESQRPAVPERMQFLLSRQLDGDLTSEESLELAEMSQNEAAAEYLTRITDLSRQLNSMSINPVSEAFSMSVRDAILRHSALAPAAMAAESRSGWTMPAIVSVTMAVCALGLVIVLRPPGPEKMSRNVVQSDIPVSHSEMATLPEISAESSDAEVVATEQVAMLPQDELRPFLESDDWRIVVVQVNSKDREDVMRDIQALVAKNDMNIRSVVSNDELHNARFGVLLTSTGVDEKDFIDSVVPQTDARLTDWNAQTVAESSRESLINRMQESLRTPTYSELNFGQVYVTLPKPVESTVAGDQSLLAKNDIAADTTFSRSSSEEESGVRSLIAPAAALSENRKPVLVVFEFTRLAIDHI